MPDARDAGEAAVDGADARDADAESTCDASDPDCTTHELSCAEAPWCPVSSPLDPQAVLTAVWGSGKTDVWAVGSNGTIMHFDGTAWKAMPAGIPVTFNAVWGSGPNDVWAACGPNVLFHSEGMHGASATWTNTPLTTEETRRGRAYTIWGTSPNDIRIGGEPAEMNDPETGVYSTFNLMRRTAGDAGPSWKFIEGVAAIHGIWGSSADDVWMIADNSEDVPWMRAMILHGTKAGDGADESWTPVDSQSSVVLDGIWGSSANDVWAVGDQGTIRHFSGGAARWDIVASPTSARLHAVWGSSARDVWAVGDSGTILHYDGAAWTASPAAFVLGKKPDLRGVWGSGANDVWIVGDGVVLHYTGPKSGAAGGEQ
ncbi:Type IV fimbrial biogenesis protein PilY1 [Labilithrix luteola]|uniref:Type IV fimbrial biogenesis protein PilY1 n=1 Tax=Labilithrix luteola TaxID=1391654 RepID=A0A0K1QG71_9BACT|nr:Type IV fimbrial biogenesis protein PilY1 [Labilithrix luteola]